MLRRPGLRRLLLVLSLGTGCGTAPPTPATPPADASPIVADEAAPAPAPADAIATAPAEAPPHPRIAATATADDVDGDGVPNAGDACPELPEDLDGFEDDDGCPDRDNDGDRVPDAHAWLGDRWSNCDQRTDHGVTRDCRNIPEDYDGEADHDGCWDERICEPPRIGRATYDPETLRFAEAEVAAIVAAAAPLLKDHPGGTLRLCGHSGSTSTPALARERSQRAAAALRDALVRRGLPAGRLEIRGFADELPLESNRDAAGRRANHRVEVQGSWGCEPEPTGSMRCV